MRFYLRFFFLLFFMLSLQMLQWYCMFLHLPKLSHDFNFFFLRQGLNYVTLVRPGTCYVDQVSLKLAYVSQILGFFFSFFLFFSRQGFSV